jgi:hypothetical protein
MRLKTLATGRNIRLELFKNRLRYIYHHDFTGNREVQPTFQQNH